MGKKSTKQDADDDKFVNDEYEKAFNEKNEKDGNMNKIKINWKTVKTVVVTLVVIAWFFVGSIAGWNAKSWFNENVKSEVKSLSAVVSKG